MKVKVALLQRFRLTTEGFREKFRNSKPEDSETASHFAARLANYFDGWVELSGTEKCFGALREHMVAEQFLDCYSHKQTVFIQERKPKSLAETIELADRFIEAQGLKNL